MSILIYVLTGFFAASLGHHWYKSKLTTAVIFHKRASYKPLEIHFKPTGSVCLILKGKIFFPSPLALCKLNHTSVSPNGYNNLGINAEVNSAIFMRSEIEFPFKEKKDLHVTRNGSTRSPTQYEPGTFSGEERTRKKQLLVNVKCGVLDRILLLDLLLTVKPIKPFKET